MKIFSSLDDSIIYPNIEIKNCDSFEERKTVKVIVFNNKDEICLVTNPIHNFLLLPGGGVEAGERIEEAVIRECREEIGYEVEVIQKLGEVEELRARDCKKYRTLLYVAKTKRKTLIDERTPSEVANGLVAHWMNFRNALEVCEQQYQTLKKGEMNFYNTGFNIYRDRIFLLYVYEQKLEKIP